MRLAFALGLLGLLLTAASWIVITSFAGAEPLLEFVVRDLLVWVGGSSALMAFWISWAACWAAWCCATPRRLPALLVLAWVPVNLFYLGDTAVGALSDIEKFVIRSG